MHHTSPCLPCGARHSGRSGVIEWHGPMTLNLLPYCTVLDAAGLTLEHLHWALSGHGRFVFLSVSGTNAILGKHTRGWVKKMTNGGSGAVVSPPAEDHIQFGHLHQQHLRRHFCWALRLGWQPPTSATANPEIPASPGGGGSQRTPH